MSLFKRPQFLVDLAEEVAWLRDKAGTEVAEAWYDALNDTLFLLEQHPFIGRDRKDLLPPGIRSWRVARFPRWLIFYGVDRDKNVILYRVRQGTMNLAVLKMQS
jgi:plasmid stabilization system protein ParE